MSRVLSNAGLYVLMATSIVFAIEWGTWPQVSPSVAALLLPGSVLLILPFALALAVGMALTRSSQPIAEMRVAALVAAMGSFIALVLAAHVAPTANRTFLERRRQAVSIAITDPSDREMTFGELQGAIAARSGASPKLELERHKRISFPLLCATLILVAMAYGRRGYPRATVAAVITLTSVAAYLMLRWGAMLGDDGRLSPSVGAWACHIPPLLALLPTWRIRGGWKAA